MNLPRMSLHIGDYLRDTGHLDATEHGAYLLLIMHYWATGSLPKIDKKLAIICRLSEYKWLRIKPTIFAFFSADWTHSRIDDERAEAIEKYNKSVANGKLGGRPKRNLEVILDDNREVKLDESSAKPSLTLTSKERTESSAPAAEPSVAVAKEIGQSKRDEAFVLSRQIAILAGYQEVIDQPSGWIRAPERVRKWLNSGWVPETIIAAVTAVMHRKGDLSKIDKILLPSKIEYFEAAIAQAHAENLRPLPVVKIADAKVVTIHGSKTRDPKYSLNATADRLRAELEEAIRSGSDQDPPGAVQVGRLPGHGGVLESSGGGAGRLLESGD